MSEKIAFIIGAGPSGLTAALELLERNTGVKPIVSEMTGDIGGISKTVNYKGNRIDIGGHRFFSKSDKVMEWWQHVMPLQGAPAYDDKKLNRELPIEMGTGVDPEIDDNVMLYRGRLSRIYYLRSFFDYPVSLSIQTIKNLGLWRMFLIGMSYMKSIILPIKNEKNLEEFFINRFGKKLYETFFKDYTEKVWGVSCQKIDPSWGAQRIKGLSIISTLLHAFKKLFKSDNSVTQKNTETSLIEQFLYPKLGPGQLWEIVADKVVEHGGEVNLNEKVTEIKQNEDGKFGITTISENGNKKEYVADYLLSSMPVKELISAMGESIPDEIQRVASGLVYRDFITVGLLLKNFKIKNTTNQKSLNDVVPDNWIYIQERDVRLGRLQIFNNWSPYMVADKENVWIGLEYFCSEGDELWEMDRDKFIQMAINELQHIGIINASDVIDSTLIKMPKAYPAYFGTYDHFNKIIDFTNGIKNLYLVGRNGQHRYNNADHSMLTAMYAVDMIEDPSLPIQALWEINAEEEYHEEK